MNAVTTVFLLTVLLVLYTLPAICAPVTNGSFELGLANWTVLGDGSAVVLEAPLGPFAPSQGSRHALISTGPGDRGGTPTDQTAILSDPIQIDSGEYLSFALVFLTEEFTGALGDPNRLDWFSAVLYPTQGGGGIPLLTGDASMTGFTQLGGSPVSAPDASSFFEAQRLEFSRLMDPGSYRLLFTVGDAGDNTFDSGLLIDDVSVGAVPEPANMYVAPVGLLALLSIRSLRARQRR